LCASAVSKFCVRKWLPVRGVNAMGTAKKPSRAAFEELAAQDPSALVAWVESGELDDADLSFAAEALGEAFFQVVGDVAVRRIALLLRLTEHTSPVVREGAVYGLALDVHDSAGARERLEEMARVDTSPGVRQAARDVLGGLKVDA
jgi:hypothetical protein